MTVSSSPGPHSLVFPDHRTVIADDARRFRSLDAPERWREIFALQTWGVMLKQGRGRGESICRLEADQESQWQEIQKDLLARHGQ